jgi:signal transduction histidine kinase
MDIRTRSDVDFTAEVLDPAMDIVAPQAEAKNVSVASHVEGDMTGLECDAELMKVVMVNYLSNAIKYGHDDGRVDVTLKRDADGLEVAVRNTGEGFGPDQRDQLFRKFSRLSVPAFRDRKGTGVGLYAVRQIVSLHGGRVDARSEPGQWAQFSFRLPQPIPKAATTT